MTTLRRWMQKPVHYLRNNRAVSALEYAILVGVIAVAIAAALTTFSADITTALTNIGGKVSAVKGKAIPNPN